VDKTDVGPLILNIYEIYDRKTAAIYALCEEYAARALADFRSNQDANYYWTNQTYTAEREMFAEAFREVGDQTVGWFMAHGAEYGVYLELANDRKYAAIWPTVLKYSYLFKKDLEELWGGLAA
jgi:hypothetical protein